MIQKSKCIGRRDPGRKEGIDVVTIMAKLHGILRKGTLAISFVSDRSVVEELSVTVNRYGYNKGVAAIVCERSKLE